MHTTKESLYLFSSVTNLTFDWHHWIDHEGTAQQVRFTIVNFFYLFLTIVKAFYFTKLSSVIGDNKSTRGFYFYHARSTDFNEEEIEGLWTGEVGWMRPVDPSG